MNSLTPQLQLSGIHNMGKVDSDFQLRCGCETMAILVEWWLALCTVSSVRVHFQDIKIFLKFLILRNLIKQIFQFYDSILRSFLQALLDSCCLQFGLTYSPAIL